MVRQEYRAYRTIFIFDEDLLCVSEDGANLMQGHIRLRLASQEKLG